MESPVWYRVYRNQLSFSEFENRFESTLFTESEVIPVFVLACLYQHDPHIDGIHTLQRRITQTGVTDRSLRCFYLYWVFKGSFVDESVLQGGMAGTFRSMKIPFPSDFDHTYVEDWIRTIIKSFFGIPYVTFERGDYQAGDVKELHTTLKYLEEMNTNGLDVKEKTVRKIRALASAHDDLVQLKGLFSGTIYPEFLKPYRNELFGPTLNLYWPAVLKQLHECEPLSPEEWDQVRVAHERVVQEADVEFLEYYIEQFEKYFPDCEETERLRKELEPRPEQDVASARRFLSQLSPVQRSFYILQPIPVTDCMLESFLERAKQKGMEEVLKELVERNAELVKGELQRTECTLINDIILSNQSSIFLYHPIQLILHSEGDNVFVFLPEELGKFADGRNPFNRSPLPENLLKLATGTETLNLEELWSKVVRRKIQLS